MKDNMIANWQDKYIQEGETSYKNQQRAGFQPIPSCIYRRNTDEWSWWLEGWSKAEKTAKEAEKKTNED